MKTTPTTLICCIGNPIAADDGIGCLIGRRLKNAFSGKDVKVIPEYTGSALDFVMDICGWRRVFIIDAVITGKMPPGAVRLFSEKEICAIPAEEYSHGMNLAQALRMGRRLRFEIPRYLKLIGIEIKPVASFGEKLSPAINKRFSAIHLDVVKILNQELAASAGAKKRKTG